MVGGMSQFRAILANSCRDIQVRTGIGVDRPGVEILRRGAFTSADQSSRTVILPTRHPTANLLPPSLDFMVVRRADTMGLPQIIKRSLFSDESDFPLSKAPGTDDSHILLMLYLPTHRND